MACSIKLVRLDDLIADIDSIDLSANGYSLAEDGYFPTVAPIGARSVFETITLKLQGTSKDDLAAMTQEINEKVKQVQWWIEAAGVERYQVWIRVQQENETYARQAMILNIVPPENVRLFTPEEINQNYIGEYQIGIERTPFWEDPYPYPTTTSKSLGSIGGSAALSETIEGDVPARLVYTIITGGIADSVTDVWMGWKSNRMGTVANFVPVWSLEDATTLDADTTVVADTTAYSGNKIRTTFSAVATLLQRAYIEANHVTANPNDQRGTYNVLMRAKMSDTSIARVRIGYSLSAGTAPQNPVYRSRKIISGTVYKIFEMGKISIPPSRIFTGNLLTDFNIGVEAERLSGAGALDMDCLILIPADEGSIKLTAAAGIVLGQRMVVSRSADDNVFAWSDAGAMGGGLVVGRVVPEGISNWSLPANGDKPVLVLTSSDITAGCTKGSTVSVDYSYIPRWRTLRGNST